MFSKGYMLFMPCVYGYALMVYKVVPVYVRDMFNAGLEATIGDRRELYTGL
jgi:hypothetical protein